MKPLKPTFFLPVFLMLVAAASNCGKKYIHPNTAYFDSINAGKMVLDINSEYPAIPGELDFIFAGTDGAKLENAAGESGDFPALEVQSAVLSRNRIFLIFQGINRVFVYNFDGQFVTEIGREGRGPGEFLMLRGLAYDEKTETLYVLEDNEVEVFKPAGTDYEYQFSSILKNSMSSGICADGGEIAIAGVTVGENVLSSNKDRKDFDKRAFPLHLIKRYNQSMDSVLADIGEAYPSYSGNPILDMMFSQGTLLCSEGVALTYLYPRYGYALVFNRSKMPETVLRFEGFSPRRAVETHISDWRTAGVENELSDHVHTFISALSYQNYRIFQIGHMNLVGSFEEVLKNSKRADDTAMPQLLNFVVDTETGEITGSREITRRILAANKYGALIAVYAETGENSYEPVLYFHKNGVIP